MYNSSYSLKILSPLSLQLFNFGFIAVISCKIASAELWQIPPETPCIYIYIYIFFFCEGLKHTVCLKTLTY